MEDPTPLAMLFRKKKKNKQVNPATPQYDESALQNEANVLAKQQKEQRTQAEKEGRAKGDELINREMQGLTPQQKLAMRESGQHRVGREYQGYQRQLAAQQSRRGIRGGTAYSQQADLANHAAEAGRQSERDLSELDADQRLKNIAASFAVEKGEGANQALDRQSAIDELRLREDRKRQRSQEDRFNHLFSRI